MQYWKWVGTNNIIHGKLGKLDLRYLTEEQAKQLLLERSQHLAITDAGRKKPLFTTAEILPLVRVAKTMDEATGFARLSNASSVKAALLKKAEELVP